MSEELVLIPKQNILHSQPIVSQTLKDQKTSNKAEKFSLLQRQPTKLTQSARPEDKYLPKVANSFLITCYDRRKIYQNWKNSRYI